MNDPIRVAEQISMLDTLSSGRLILGLGRGAGRVEFDAFRQDMADSRNRFIECRMRLKWIRNGICEYQGKFVNQPKAAIDPSLRLPLKVNLTLRRFHQSRLK